MSLDNLKKKTYSCYAIQCKKNGKVYVGVTSEVETRIKHHFYELNAGNHGNCDLQNDYITYGRDEFEIFEMKKDIPYENKGMAELDYILKFKSYIPEQGYNKKDRRVGRALMTPITIINGEPKINR